MANHTDWIKYGMTEESFRLNFGADKVADEAAALYHNDRNADKQNSDNKG